METVLTPVRGPAPGSPTPGVPKTYRIIRTNEVDPKDPPVPPTSVAPLGAPAAPVDDNFGGTARKSAKLSIASGSIEPFADLQELIKTLPSKTKMTKHKPPITTDISSDRVVEENRNVRLRAFLYAASREADNDFHLIIGRDPTPMPHVYMTAEVSGLPPRENKIFAQVKAVRDAYKQFFGNNLPAETYDFYDPPVPVEIEGSLFFDMSHANGQGPGPQSLRKDIPTIWEIHPISRLVFEP